MRAFFLIPFLFATLMGMAQSAPADTSMPYKKRVLENTEIDLLGSYYSQNGDHAAVSGGIGNEKLTDIAPSIILSIPLNADDVLGVEGSISAYTSASSSNVDPFDGEGNASPFQASSGASGSDLWWNGALSYQHSSDDRNKIWSARLSLSNEYDYASFGVGGSFARLCNEKNTEVSLKASVFIDAWRALYPIELRPFSINGNGLDNGIFSNIRGNKNYQPDFKKFENEGRNSYAIGLGFSQILSKKLQGSLSLDVIQQQGLLSTPFQRVYFADVADSYINDFPLAEDIERLPDTRLKAALGGRMNYYINERLLIRSYYRFYHDDWGINSHTASLELPIKLIPAFTLYPSYRFYYQAAANYFAPFNEHLSSEEFYTSDYDLSGYIANMYGLGIGYTDIFTKLRLWKAGLKSVNLKYSLYQRSNGLNAGIVTLGAKFVLN